MSRLKYQMNLAHLRIRGMPAMKLQIVQPARPWPQYLPLRCHADHEIREFTRRLPSAKNGVFMERQRED